MKLGIVGHAAEKFTPETEQAAIDAIVSAVYSHKPTHIVSGHSPMGGIDIWAEEVAANIGVPTEIYAPTTLSWGAPGGFKERNLRIARASDLVLCIVVRELPPDFDGGVTFTTCYHCKGHNPPHIKSGGCWTAWRCRQREWRIIP